MSRAPHDATHPLKPIEHALRQYTGKYTPQYYLQTYGVEKHLKKAAKKRGGQTPKAHSGVCPFPGTCVCYEAVEQEGYILAEIVDASPALCLAAVQENGFVLLFVSDAEQRANPDIAAAAVKQCGAAVKYCTPLHQPSVGDTHFLLRTDSHGNIIPTHLLDDVKDWLKEYHVRTLDHAVFHKGTFVGVWVTPSKRSPYGSIAVACEHDYTFAEFLDSELALSVRMDSRGELFRETIHFTLADVEATAAGTPDLLPWWACSSSSSSPHPNVTVRSKKVSVSPPSTTQHVVPLGC